MKTIKVNDWIDIPKNFTGIAEYSDGLKEWFQNGQRHREVGPCTSCTDCLQGNSELCSKPGPAIEYPDGTKKWFQNGQFHREDGPAVIYSSGRKYWYQNDQLHREVGPCTRCTDCLKGNFELCSKPGPAIEFPNGEKEWLQNGKRHREDGPAIVHPDGTKNWFINGEQVSEISFKVFQLCLEKK